MKNINVAKYLKENLNANIGTLTFLSAKRFRELARDENVDNAQVYDRSRIGTVRIEDVLKSKEYRKILDGLTAEIVLENRESEGAAVPHISFLIDGDDWELKKQFSVAEAIIQAEQELEIGGWRE